MDNDNNGNEDRYSLKTILAEENNSELIERVSELDILEVKRLVPDNNARDDSYFAALKNSRDYLALAQTEMERMARMEDEGIVGAYEQLRQFILSKLLGRKILTIDDVFELQRKNSQELNTLLGKIISYSRVREEELYNALKGRITEQRLHHLGFKRASDDLKIKQGLYEQRKEEAESLDWENGLDTALINMLNLKVDIMRTGHQAGVINACRQYTEQEIPFLEAIYFSLLKSTDTCEKLHNGTEHVLRTLDIARKTYSAQLDQTANAKLLYSQVDDVSHNVAGVCGLLTPALQQLMSLSQQPIANTLGHEARQQLKLVSSQYADETVKVLDISSTMKAMCSPQFISD